MTDNEKDITHNSLIEKLNKIIGKELDEKVLKLDKIERLVKIRKELL